MNEDDSDFQTAHYDKLCGCVAVLIPAEYYAEYRNNTERNHAMTRRLLETQKGQRIVDADCARCGGTGLRYPLAEAGDIIDFKRSVLACEVVEFSCGRKFVPKAMKGNPAKIDHRCGMDDCAVCRGMDKDNFQWQATLANTLL